VGLWVPPKVSRELLAEREQYRADLDDSAVREKILRVKGLLDEATYRLRAAFGDDLLEVVRAPGTVKIDSAMKPNYYVIIRWNEGAPPTVINIEGPNGEFVDLDGNIDAAVRMMHANDMRNPAVRRSFTEAKERARVEAERQKVRDREERLEEMRDRLNAATRTSVSMNRDQPWTQNSSGRRYKGKG
jgi:hypothetical protein